MTRTMTTPTDRAMAVSLRTYHRPLDDGTLESWDDVVNRVIAHQEWLWVRAKDGKALDADEKRELDDLRQPGQWLSTITRRSKNTASMAISYMYMRVLSSLCSGSSSSIRLS
eukprot:jgi/Mesvir1/15096/Mv14736-RA.1